MNVFSFCLYGPYAEMYYRGMKENIALVATHFPGWKVYVYVGPDVTEDMMQFLRNQPNVVVRETGVTGAPNMIHRFYAIDEPDVQLMMVRDADSRIHWKDRWAIREFVKSSFLVHTVRDNKEHTAKMMGGLWGIKKAAGINMRETYAAFKDEVDAEKSLGHDQNFLGEVLYPQIWKNLLVHYSNGRAMIGETAVEFPFAWTNDLYCGRVELEYIDRPQPVSRPRVSFPSVVVRLK